MFRKFNVIYIFILTLILVVGCTNNNNNTSGKSNLAMGNKNLEQTFQQVQNAARHQTYFFDGSASLQRDNYNSNKLINFRGHSEEERNLYLNLAIAPRDQGVIEDMDFLTQEDTLYMRFADDIEWQKIEENSPVIHGEMSQWNPVHHFERMTHLNKEIVSVGAPGNGEIETIKVVLDPQQLRTEFIESLRSRFDGEQGKNNINARFEKVILSGDDESLFVDEINSIQDELSTNIKELEDSLEIQGDYIISYDPKTKTPTRMEYTQQIEFFEDGEQEREISKIEFYFRDYGEKLNLPDLRGIK